LKGVVAAPLTAIQRGAPGTYVYLIDADNTVSVRKVKLGPQNDGMVAVTEGLAPGDRVVVDGTDRLRDGAEVFIAASDGVAVGAPDAAKSGAGAGKGKGQHRNHAQQGAPAEGAQPAAAAPAASPAAPAAPAR
jgi:multidrug efflux system membrane fusion protein